jgi:hypothetical protein
MPFTGKATYGAGADLPELAEDVSEMVSLVSAVETPLLDRIGDAGRSVSSTLHEWVEDDLLPNTDTVTTTTFSPSGQDATLLQVSSGARFRPGDLVRPAAAREVMLVTDVVGNQMTVVRRYGGSPASTLQTGSRLVILANAALEGDDAPAARFTGRARRRNWTQIFTAGVSVSGSMQASRSLGVDDEVQYQQSNRLRELLRDLENCVINGVAPAAVQQGSATVRRTMGGLISMITTNAMSPGTGGIPLGTSGGTDLTEPMLNAALRQVWEGSAGRVDTLVVGGALKRRINSFLTPLREAGTGSEVFRDGVSVYESDFGTCRVVLSRWVPPDTCLLLDRSRISVLPLAGRSFHYRPLGASGDRDQGQLIGEYTLELRNESAHGVLRGLT